MRMRGFYIFAAWLPIVILSVRTLSAANHFVENFDTIVCAYTDTNTVLPSGTWTVFNVFNESASSSRGGTGKAARVNDDTVGAHLTSPTLNTVGTVSFYYRELNSGGGTFNVQKSVAGAPFTNVASQVFAGTNFTFLSVDVNDVSSAIQIRILNNNNPGHLIVDDMTVTDFVMSGSNQPPVLSVIGNKAVAENSLLEFGVLANDPVDGDSITLVLSNAPSGSFLSSTNGAGTFTWALPTPDGVYTMTFFALDKDGFDSETITVTVSAQVQAISLIWDFENGWQTWTNFSRFSDKDWTRINSSGAEGTAWKMEVNGRNADSASDDWLISPRMNVANVSDPTFSYWTKRENRGPDMTVKISTNYPGIGDPLAPGVSWASLSFTPPSLENVWTATTNDLSAYIGGTNVNIAFHYTSIGTGFRDAERWSVDQIRYDSLAASSNEPPVLSPLGNKSVTLSNMLSFAVMASDPVDGDPITLSGSNLPPGSTFFSTNGVGTFSWTNAFPVGVYTARFYAVDKDGQDVEAVVISVYDPLAPTNLPVLSPIGSKFVLETNTLIFAVNATDVDGDTLTLTASNLPVGATFLATNGSGVFVWSNASPAGSYGTRFYVQDNDGTEFEEVFITVIGTSPTGTLFYQGFEGSVVDTWNFSGSGSATSSAAKVGALGWQMGGTESIDLAQVSIAGYTDVTVQISVASTGGIENLDALRVFVALNGAAFSTTSDITITEGSPTDGVFNLSWNYSAPNEAATTAGVPATFNGDGTNGYSRIRIAIPASATSISVRIRAGNNVGTEYYHVDDIKLTSGALAFADPPVLAPIGNRNAGSGVGLLFNVTASNFAGDPISLSASNLPPGALFMDYGGGTGRFLWAAAGPVGVYTAAFFAVDNSEMDSELVVFNISPAVYATNTMLKIMAANITSGSSQSYEDPGIRIFQGLKPDVVGIQEFNHSGGLRAFVDTAFGPEFSYFEEPGNEQIPNGIISRYPILSSGEWEDTYVANRDFAWAILDIPGTQNLYVVSAHLLTSSPAERNSEAILLKGYIQSNWPSNALIVICGDLNTLNRTESAILTLGAIVSDAHQPADQNGDKDTNASRASDYDYVLPGIVLDAKHVATELGGLTFPDGCVFDSRLWASPPSPVIGSDSGELNMQHMAVMKTFAIDEPTAPPTNATIYTLGSPHGSIVPGDSLVNFGASQAFAISADSGYQIGNVLVDGISIGVTGSYTFVGVTNNRSLAAHFVPIPLDPNADVDGDGMPNWFELQNSSSATGLVASADLDADLFSNLEEYQADTQPTNADSCLRMLNISSVNAGAAQVFWQGGVSSRQYVALYLEPLGTGPAWKIIFTNPPPTSVTNSLLDFGVESTVTGGWYRLEAARP